MRVVEWSGLAGEREGLEFRLESLRISSYCLLIIIKISAFTSASIISAFELGYSHLNIRTKKRHKRPNDSPIELSPFFVTKIKISPIFQAYTYPKANQLILFMIGKGINSERGLIIDHSKRKIDVFHLLLSLTQKRN
jgi:hypothetical protein